MEYENILVMESKKNPKKIIAVKKIIKNKEQRIRHGVDKLDKC